MKIGVDCSILSKKYLAGVASVLVTALNEWTIRNPEINFILFSFSAFNDGICKDLFTRENVQVVISPSSIFKKNAFFWFLSKLPFIIRANKLDIYWAPATIVPFMIKKPPLVLCSVYDVVHKELRGMMSHKNKIVSALFFDNSINRADNLWADSYYTASMIEKYYKKRKSKKIMVGISIDMRFFKKNVLSLDKKNGLLNKYMINKSSKLLLFVGTLEPRKNIGFLLQLMPKLARESFELLVIGASGWGETKITDIVNSTNYPRESVHFAGYLQNEELLHLYNIADCFVSTSLNEGFGLPQLEAIACRLPVVAANNSAVSEVVNNAGILVDGWEINEWVEKIIFAVNNSKQIIERYEKKVKEYNWELIILNLMNYISDEIISK
ncbi:glycosyl transferase [Spirochaetia bacterium]|nr:glycosyl transferase [Spirochaetia bacterium]